MVGNYAVDPYNADVFNAALALSRRTNVLRLFKPAFGLHDT